MNMEFLSNWRRALVWPAVLLVSFTYRFETRANPTGGTVTQGQATINSQGSTLNINQSSAGAWINWQTFNVGQGETVNFNQPSASSVTWNQINDPNPSQILGSINANGYVVLQNSSGFVVGGQASLNVHGLVMTTASTPAINLGGTGPWSFDAPPPTAKIVNYGQINITGGGSAYLIANDIENNGTISAPGGKIGLYAGEQVLLSMTPDGRSLSAKATIPEGLVDNNGNLIANGGSISLQAQVVNQNGLIQANSAQNVNGTIELVGGDSVNLGANSTISAQGDSQGVSSGGSVSIQGGNTFSDQVGSTINVSGGAQGGNGGQVEMSAPVMGAIYSLINGQALDGFTGGAMTIDPNYIWLALGTTDSQAPPGFTIMSVGSFTGMASISLTAVDDIVLNTVWTLPANLSLFAGNYIDLENNSGIKGGNFTINLNAGTTFAGTTVPASGSDGIYLIGNAYIQSQTGNINLLAANEVTVNSGSITTTAGGNIDVTAEFGNVNTGTSGYGFTYNKTAPYTTVSPQLGGISTADGGNVDINAGGNVISFSATTVAPATLSGQGDPDPGTGCFGGTAAGNLTINAGGSVTGCYVVMDGQGTINARNIGTSANNVALSLATGGWTLNALNSIYLQEVRNPNGLFNITTVSSVSTSPSAASHLFNYSPNASLTLDAGNAVYLTGFGLSRMTEAGVPMLLPPVVNITAGPGGVVLNTPNAFDSSGNAVTLSDDDITLFPSIYQSLEITTTGGGWLSSGNAGGTDATLLMSDSGLTQWINPVTSGSTFEPFGENDHAGSPPELNNPNPVTIDLSGSQLVNGTPIYAGMENVILQTDKATDINIAGDMIGCSFYGENLHSGDTTSITVGGQIFNAGTFTSVTLADAFPTLPADDTPLVSELSLLLPNGGASLNSWYLPLILAIPDGSLDLTKNGTSLNAMLGIMASALGTEFAGLPYNSLAYNPNTRTLTAIGSLPANLVAALESPTLTFVRFDANGFPVLNGNDAVTDTINWVPANSANYNLISTLSAESQQSVALGSLNGAYVVGGPGQFNITAGSINLGNAEGILSVGDADENLSGRDYSFLAPYTTSAANIDVTADYLEMPASTIACLANGGSITVTASGQIPGSALNANGIGVSMDLGSQELEGFEAEIMNTTHIGLGIYTTGGGNVNLTAQGTINVDSSRVATFDGGNIDIVSKMGDLNAGNGSTGTIPVNYFDPNFAGANNPLEQVPANGIIAATLTGGSIIPPGAVLLPGNITIYTPEGSVYASAGGISQIAYNETLSASSGSATINLHAGSPGYIGNLNLGESGVIGINVDAYASGDINGLIFAEGNANINTAGSFTGTVFSGGSTSISSGGAISGTIVAVGGLSTSGGGNLSASVFSGSVNGGAGTLATTAVASSSSTSAASQTSAQGQQQIASNSGDDDKKKNKKKDMLRTIGRVTILLGSAMTK